MLQQIIVFLIITAAVFYIGRMLWSAVAGEGGCHSCSSNPASKSYAKKKNVKLPQHLIQMQTSSKCTDSSNGTSKPH
jgi:hypothetical protein